MANAEALGIGTVFKIGSGAAPTTLADKTDWIKSLGLQETLDSVDITKLNDTSYCRNYILGLFSAMVNGSFDDSPVAADSFFKHLHDISRGTSHSAGRGKVSFGVYVGGETTGNLQITGTALVNGTLSLNLGVGDPIGGDFSLQVCGALTVSAQS